MALTSDSSKRNIVFCGEVGAGKSSAINLLLVPGTSPPVPTSNNSRPCTQDNASYQTTLGGVGYRLWDTRGLGEARNILLAFFRRSSKKDLREFLRERHEKNEIDLLVYCVRGLRATTAAVKCYHHFYAITSQWAVPIVLLVTWLEREKNMDDWWNKNSPSLKELKMEFDDHACITTLPGHPRLPESKERLIDLITKNHRQEAEHSADFSIRKPTLSVSPRNLKGGISRLFKGKDRGKVDDGVSRPCQSDRSGPPSTAPSRDSIYHTAESPRGSVPPSPTVVPPTPSSETASVHIPQTDTDLLGVSDTSQSASEDTNSMRSSLHSMLDSSPYSSHTSHSEVHLPFYTEENEDHFNELPFRHLTPTVKRRKGYATHSGAFGDIWECDLISGETIQKVAVKAMKTNANGDEDLRSHDKKLRRELKVWGKLQHSNVVPLLGVVSGFGPLLSMRLNISEKHQLLKDIATGLCYLHNKDIIHGDLHSGNVLIGEDGTACLTDFGLSLIQDFVGTSYLKSSICGGVQFADPALVQRVDSSPNEVTYPTKPCDVYSFGGLILHVLSGKKPYEEIHSTNVILTVLKGERPQIPTNVPQWHKSVIRACWNHEEPERPLADDLVGNFKPQ